MTNHVRNGDIMHRYGINSSYLGLTGGLSGNCSGDFAAPNPIQFLFPLHRQTQAIPLGMNVAATHSHVRMPHESHDVPLVSAALSKTSSEGVAEGIEDEVLCVCGHAYSHHTGIGR